MHHQPTKKAKQKAKPLLEKLRDWIILHFTQYFQDYEGVQAMIHVATGNTKWRIALCVSMLLTAKDVMLMKDLRIVAYSYNICYQKVLKLTQRLVNASLGLRLFSNKRHCTMPPSRKEKTRWYSSEWLLFTVLWILWLYGCFLFAISAERYCKEKETTSRSPPQQWSIFTPTYKQRQQQQFPKEVHICSVRRVSLIVYSHCDRYIILVWSHLGGDDGGNGDGGGDGNGV